MLKFEKLIAFAFTAAALSFGAPTFTSIDYPGADATYAIRVNHFGQVFGYYTVAGVSHGFIWQNGNFTTIPDFPGATSTIVLGANNDGLIAGSWSTATSGGNFLYNINTKQWTNVSIPGSTSTTFYDIDPGGQTTGVAALGGKTFGFFGVGGAYKLLSFPKATATFGYGVSGSGDGSVTERVVGAYQDANSVMHGMLWTVSGFMGVDYPNANSTTATGIYASAANSSIQIVGFYSDASNVQHSFLFSGLSSFTQIDYPGGTNTAATGINDAGWIAGTYVSSNAHGFLRKP